MKSSCAWLQRASVVVTIGALHCGGHHGGAPTLPPTTPSATADAGALPAVLPLGKESMYASINEGDRKTADAIVENVWPARGYAPAQLDWPLTWTEDPYQDAFWRFMFYGLQYTSHLLWAWGTTGEQKYADKLVAILKSYVAYDQVRTWNRLTFDNPHPSAYRAMVLVNSYFKLKAQNRLPADLDQLLKDAIERLGVYLSNGKHMPEQFSSFEGNCNHGFNEAAALLLIADNFPDMQEASTWRDLAVKRLDLMRTSNVDPDGVDIENSPYYHLYVMGLVSAIAQWSQTYEQEVAPSYTTTLQGMLHYGAYVTQPNFRLPQLGATTDAYVPQLDPVVYSSMVPLDANFAFVYERGAEGQAPKTGVELFPTAGLFTLRADPTALEQTFLTFDSGKYRTEHSHLDALSITLYSGGVELLPDSGLMTYDAGADFDYFHGTRGHNTVVVDGVDQIAGDAVPLTWGTVGTIAWASGSSDLYTGVHHVRSVVLLEQDLVLVTDTLSSTTPHTYTQTWHLFPSAQAPTTTVAAPLNATVSDSNQNIVLAINQYGTDGVTLATTNGAMNPMQGWYSNAYGKKVPNYALEYAVQASSTRFVTLLASGTFAASGKSPTVAVRGDLLTVCGGATPYTVTIDPTGAIAVDASIAVTGGC